LAFLFNRTNCVCPSQTKQKKPSTNGSMYQRILPSFWKPQFVAVFSLLFWFISIFCVSFANSVFKFASFLVYTVDIRNVPAFRSLLEKHAVFAVVSLENNHYFYILAALTIVFCALEFVYCTRTSYVTFKGKIWL
jgi:hypothetical protein